MEAATVRTVYARSFRSVYPGSQRIMGKICVSGYVSIVWGSSALLGEAAMMSIYVFRGPYRKSLSTMVPDRGGDVRCHQGTSPNRYHTSPTLPLFQDLF